MAFDAERDGLLFLFAAVAFGLLGVFVDFVAADFLAGILTSYPCARKRATPEEAA
ncbi:MAG: hypothetical protein VB933_10215 [Pseudomonadales bacterium]